MSPVRLDPPALARGPVRQRAGSGILVAVLGILAGFLG